ncbi:MAG: ABC transporter permease [Ignavibacteriae bacterium]|nr:ABC transporter permease [Ignavibacteriota bacterium]
MSYSSFIAKRYLKARRKDSFISFIATIAILGVMLGTAALITALAVLGGFEREITEKVIGFTSQVQILGFQNNPLTNYLKTTARIENSSPLIKAVEPFAAREALIRSKEGIDGVLLKGIDHTRDITLTRRFIVLGEYGIHREPGSLARIVIGKKLATRLATNVGDKLTIFGPGSSGEFGQMRAMQFVVTGIYESGMAEYDDVYAFTALEDAQDLFQLGDAVTGYDILLTHADSAAAVADRLQELLGYPHYARTVFQNYRNIFSWIELQKQPVPFILALIIIVAAVNVIGTLLMMVLTKMKDIGVLTSFGATRWGIIKIFLRQGFAIAFAGTLLGNLLAGALCYGQDKFKLISLPSDIYFMTSVPILLQPEYFVFVSAVSIGLCMLCSLVPAWLAARVDPVTAIRFA